jgi:hypothetical protein
MQAKKHSTLQEKNPSKRKALLELQEELKRMEKKMALLTRPSTVPRAELMVQHWAHKNTAVSQLTRADKEPNVHARWPMAHLGFHGLESVAKKELALGNSGEDPFRNASCCPACREGLALVLMMPSLCHQRESARAGERRIWRKREIGRYVLDSG